MFVSPPWLCSCHTNITPRLSGLTTHTHTHLFVCVSFLLPLSVCSLCLSLSFKFKLSPFWVFNVYLSGCVSILCPFVHLCVLVRVCVSGRVAVCLSVYFREVEWKQITSNPQVGFQFERTYAHWDACVSRDKLHWCRCEIVERALEFLNISCLQQNTHTMIIKNEEKRQKR